MHHDVNENSAWLGADRAASSGRPVGVGRPRGRAVLVRRVLVSTTVLFLVLANAAMAFPTPKWGRWTGDHSMPVRFRVNRAHGLVLSFHMVTDCGTYDVAAVALAHGKFHFRVGPADRPLQVIAQTSSSSRFVFEWNVGYTDLSTPTCLLHDEWSASWRSR